MKYGVKALKGSIYNKQSVEGHAGILKYSHMC